MSTPPKPGIYKTEPYTCLLKVPEFQHDDTSVHSSAKPVPEMPTHHPELKLIPQAKGQSLGLKEKTDSIPDITNSVPDIHLELPKTP